MELRILILAPIFFSFFFEDFGFRSSLKIELSSGPVLIKLDLN